MFDLNIIIALILTFLLSIVLNLFMIRYSAKLKLIDVPNERSLHNKPKSRGGGVAIISSFILGCLLLDLKIDSTLIYCFFIIFILGLVDDVIKISSKTKFLFIGIAAIILFFNGYAVYNFGLFLNFDIILNPYLAFIVFVIAIVGFVNAMNLIDGLDGLSSGVAIVILSGYSYMGYMFSDSLLFYTSSILVASLLGFLIFNWNPSKLFMGDSGSLTLGFVIASLSIYSILKGYFTPITVLLLTALPIIDTIIVMLRRIRQKQSPFLPDKTHIHHLTLKMQKKNVKRTAVILILLQLIFTYIGIAFKVRDDFYILIIFIMLLTFFYMILTPPKNIEK